MQRIPYSELKKGTFLIASPDINEGPYFRSVILLCDHSPVGSFGVILNKDLDIDISEGMIGLEDISESELKVRAGGPNQPNQIMILHNHPEESEENLDVCDGVYLGGDLDQLQEMSTENEDLSLLLCLGYSGWGAGALEREFLNGAWFLHPATSEKVFHTPPDRMWQTFLREMGGKYKTLSMIPEDLDLN